METYLNAKGIGQTDFASTIGTTDRTLRSFRRTGKVRRDMFESIAKAMGTTKEALLRPE
jgi:plasmid maintenance system antidote protein VapI